MNPFPWLSLVMPDFPASTSTANSGPGSAVSSPMQSVQWWLQLSSPLPILPISCSLFGRQIDESDPARKLPVPSYDVLHVIAVGSPAALQNCTVEFAVQLANAAAARLSIMPLAGSADSGTGMPRQMPADLVEADQQIRLRLAQTDYRTLPYGVRITGSVGRLSDALVDSVDSGQFRLLLVSAKDLAALDPEQHGLPQLLLMSGVAVLAHAEPEHE